MDEKKQIFVGPDEGLEDGEKNEKVFLTVSGGGFVGDVSEEVIIRGLNSRDWLTKASILIMVVSNFLTFCIIILYGFKVYGFSLPESFLHWLGGATIGTIIANTTVLYKHLYKESIFKTKSD